MARALAALALGAVLSGAACAQGAPWTQLTPEPKTAAAEVATLVRQGKPLQALQRADTELEHKPRDAQLRFLRGVALSDLGRQAEASLAFESLSQDFPELPEPYNNLAVIEASKGRLEQAERLLLQSLAAQPQYVTAEENLGDL